MANEAKGTPKAAPGSPLASLRQRRDAAVKELHLDLPVQRLDPPVFVRFQPVEDGFIEGVHKRMAKSKDPARNVVANAVILAEACVGVFEVIDGEEVSVDPEDRDGDWPTFDQRLGELLGIESTKAADVVRGLYLTDGDILATATKVASWSGYSLEDVEEREGN